jgi:hypothetical protein
LVGGGEGGGVVRSLSNKYLKHKPTLNSLDWISSVSRRRDLEILFEEKCVSQSVRRSKNQFQNYECLYDTFIGHRCTYFLNIGCHKQVDLAHILDLITGGFLAILFEHFTET